MNSYVLETKTPSIKLFHFMGRIGEVYMGIENTLEILSHGQVQEMIHKKMTEGIENYAYGLIDPKKVEEFGGIEAARKQIELSIPLVKGSIKKKYVDEFPVVILNQGLVMVCTVFETYLNDSLWTITRSKPEILNTLSPKKELKLEEILQSKDYDSLLSTIQEKTLDHFSRQGIAKKFSDLEKIGIETAEVFKFSNIKPESQAIFKRLGFKELEEIFQKRHDVVHKDAQPLIALEELRKIRNFLEGIIVSLTFAFSRKYVIVPDFLVFLIERGNLKSKEDIMNFLKTDN